MSLVLIGQMHTGNLIKAVVGKQIWSFLSKSHPVNTQHTNITNHPVECVNVPSKSESEIAIGSN